MSIIDIMKKDIESGTLMLGLVAEQEEYLEPKINRLREAVMELEARMYARRKGILTEAIPV